MQQAVARQLLELNREFYQSHGLAFAEKRARLQPGVLEVVNALAPTARVLDIGCGHGLVAAALAARHHRGAYCGIDSSAVLLEAARASSQQSGFAFHQVNLAGSDWAQGLNGPFDVILCFAVLHHLPGLSLREHVVAAMSSLLGPCGRVEVSVWNFMASERLQQHILPWERVKLTSDEVEAGDYLLDWRHQSAGLRYVHAFDSDQLAWLARQAGLIPAATRYSDGEGDHLGLYQSWSKLPTS